MEAWLTREWQRNSLWQLVLRPISWLFGLLAAMRRAAFRKGLLRSHSIGVPVIIVGNITVGGTGKTPLVLAIVALLKQHGKHCGIVTRGYQLHPGDVSAATVHVVRAAPGEAVVSDEATLLARRAEVPVYACANRVEAARTLLRDRPEVDVIISDDGLQHYALQRNIEICVIDGARGLGNNGLLPAGPLREPASRLDAVDAIVVNRANGRGDVGSNGFSARTPAFDMTLANELFMNVKTGRRMGLGDAVTSFHGKSIHALAGTGNPQRFFNHLRELGLSPGTSRAFPDHHRYVASDLQAIGAEIILMTEKDAVKCDAFADDRMWFMQVDAVLPEKFADFVLKKLTEQKADHVARPEAA